MSQFNQYESFQLAKKSILLCRQLIEIFPYLERNFYFYLYQKVHNRIFYYVVENIITYEIRVSIFKISKKNINVSIYILIFSLHLSYKTILVSINNYSEASITLKFI